MNHRYEDAWLITLSLAVHASGSGIGTSGTTRLFERRWGSAAVPPDGAMMQTVWGEGEWYASSAVRRVWWYPNGSAHIELVAFHLDPLLHEEGLCDGRHRNAWRSDADGDLPALLLASGWSEYKPRSAGLGDTND